MRLTAMKQPKRRMVLALALLLVLAACGGTADEGASTEAPSPTSSTTPPTTVTTVTTTTTTTTPEPPPMVDDHIVVGEPIRLASTHKVANVSMDDVLNARYLPGAGGPLAAELDPAYSTFRVTGDVTTVSDGGEWSKVILTDPAVQLVHDVEEWSLPYGWVNAFYTEPLAELGPIGGTCAPDGSLDDHPGDPDSAYDQLLDLFYSEHGDCSQLVITLSQKDGMDRLGVTLPNIRVLEAPSGPFRIEIPPNDVRWIQVLWPSTSVFTDDLAAYITRGVEGQIWIDIYGAAEKSVRYLHDRGQIVVDIRTGAGELPARADSVAASRLEGLGLEGSEMIVGYARPFEANLSVSVLNSEGTVLDVPVSGDAVTQYGPGAYGVMTTDWFETWGWFAITVHTDGLPAGEYFVHLADDGALEDGPFVDIPFTIGE